MNFEANKEFMENLSLQPKPIVELQAFSASYSQTVTTYRFFDQQTNFFGISCYKNISQTNTTTMEFNQRSPQYWSNFVGTVARRYPLLYRAFSHNVMPAILVFQTSETAAMLVFLTNPVKVELFSYVENAFFCSNIFAQMQAP